MKIFAISTSLFLWQATQTPDDLTFYRAQRGDEQSKREFRAWSGDRVERAFTLPLDFTDGWDKLMEGHRKYLERKDVMARLLPRTVVFNAEWTPRYKFYVRSNTPAVLEVGAEAMAVREVTGVSFDEVRAIGPVTWMIRFVAEWSRHRNLAPSFEAAAANYVRIGVARVAESKRIGDIGWFPKTMLPRTSRVVYCAVPTLLKSGTPKELVGLSTVLGEMPGSRTREILAQMTLNSNKQVKHAAVKALNRIGWSKANLKRDSE